MYHTGHIMRTLEIRPNNNGWKCQQEANEQFLFLPLCAVGVHFLQNAPIFAHRTFC